MLDRATYRDLGSCAGALKAPVTELRQFCQKAHAK